LSKSKIEKTGKKFVISAKRFPFPGGLKAQPNGAHKHGQTKPGTS